MKKNDKTGTNMYKNLYLQLYCVNEYVCNNDRIPILIKNMNLYNVLDWSL